MTVKGKPILFNAEMVDALLEGHKTQTRRPMRIQPCESWHLATVLADGRAVFDVVDGCIPAAYVNSPFGGVGDSLWVREAFLYHPRGDGYIKYRADNVLCVKSDFGGMWPVPQYGGYELPAWRPSIHMPRWASRIALCVKRVWVERIQDIDEIGAQCEGWFYQNHNLQHAYDPATMDTARRWFVDLWDSIYAKRGLGFETNCYVWACEFEVEQ